MAMILLFAQIGTLQGGAKVETPVSTLQSIAIAPTTVTITPGATTTFTATGTFSGSTSDVTSKCTWASSNPSAATIGPTSNPQVVNGVSLGTASISCSMQGVTGTAQLTVANAINILPSVVPSGLDGQPYSVTFTGSGGTAPYHFTIATGLAQLQTIGLHFTSPTLSGTLSTTSVGSYGFQVQITDSTSPPHVVTQNYTLIVQSATGPSRVAIKPQVWANPHEADLPNPCDAAHNCYIKHIRGPNGPAGDFACTLAGLNSSMTQWAATAPNVWWWVKIDDKLSANGQCHITSTTSSGWMWRAKSTGFPTAFIVYESEHPNPPGRTVCNHMVGISLTANLRNPGCNTTASIDDLDHMWKFTTTGVGGYGGSIINNYNQADSAGNGPSHIVVRDAEFEALGGGSTPIHLNTCNINTGVSSCPVQPPTAMSFGSHVGIERSYMHGDWYVPPTGQIKSPTGASQPNFIYLSCTLCWVDWNYFDRISRGYQNEGKVISTTNAGPGVKIVHNYIEGGEIGFLSGGAGGTFRGTPSSDEEIRANVWTRDPAWLLSAGGSGGSPIAYWDCRTSVKNPFELKEGNRYLINGNVFERSQNCGQNGQGPTITVRACSGNANCNNFTAEVSDLTLANNVMRFLENGIQTSARSVGSGNGQTVSKPTRRMNIENNLGYAIRPGVGGNGFPKNIFTLGPETYINWIQCAGSRDAAGAHATITCAQSNNSPWNSRTLIEVGDPIVTRSCTPASFNTPVGPGPPALAGTDGLQPNGRTVVYANAGPANEQVTGCVLWNLQGAPFESTYTHNTMVWSGGGVTWPVIYGGDAAFVNNCTYIRGNVFQDDIIAASAGTTWTLFNACSLSLAAAQAIAFDTSRLTFGHLLFLGNKASQANAFPAGEAGTLWSPPQAGIICSGLAADTSCVGFNGFMNNATFVHDPTAIGQDPLVFYALHPSSLYKAGNARQAHDGRDMGADMNKIRQALQETQYSGCAPGECGPTGPYPD